MRPARLLQMLLTVLPVLTAGLYLLGLTYHQGYLATFGIDDSIFPLASDKALFSGFISLFILTFPAALYTTAAVGTFVILVVLAAFLSSTTRVRFAVVVVKRWIRRGRLKSSASLIANDLLDKSTTAYGYISGFILLLLLLILMAVLSEKSGREQAESEIADFLAGKGTTAQVFSPQLPAPYSAKFVVCGDKYCAFWSSQGSLILKHEAIDRIVTHNTAPKVTDAAPKAATPAH